VLSLSQFFSEIEPLHDGGLKLAIFTERIILLPGISVIGKQLSVLSIKLGLSGNIIFEARPEFASDQNYMAAAPIIRGLQEFWKFSI